MSVEFIDTNVLLYLVDEKDHDRRKAAEALIFRVTESGTGAISFQVVQECLNVLVGKLKKPMTSEQARRFLETFLRPLWRVMPSEALYTRAIEIRTRYRFSFYDSLIVAAALVAGCTTLYSEDLQDGQRIEGLTIVNPFGS
jgi:predicted nucleic acid-binding protein